MEQNYNQYQNNENYYEYCNNYQPLNNSVPYENSYSYFQNEQMYQQNNLNYQYQSQENYYYQPNSPINQQNHQTYYNSSPFNWNQTINNFSLNNDSAYQTHLETSQINQFAFNLSNTSNLEIESPKKEAKKSSNKRKREIFEVEQDLVKLVDEIFDQSNKIDATIDTKLAKNTVASKRPKILKLEKNENDNNELNCPECTLVFYSKAKLLMHQFKYHKNGSSCVCPVCYKKFGNQANTLVHLRGHTQEKTYKCTQCDNAFYDSSTLKKHMRTHTGEKPYECNLCSKKFTQSGNLKRHLLVHQKYDDEDYENQILIESDLNQNDFQKKSFYDDQGFINNFSNSNFLNNFNY